MNHCQVIQTNKIIQLMKLPKLEIKNAKMLHKNRQVMKNKILINNFLKINYYLNDQKDFCLRKFTKTIKLLFFFTIFVAISLYKNIFVIYLNINYL